MKGYLTQPLDFSTILKGGQNNRCSLQQSIAQRIHLILVTNLGENRYDPTFGCPIWEHDFENMPNLNLWRDKMMKALKETLEKYELRLMNLQVNVEISQEEFTDGKEIIIKKIKRRVDIAIKAFVKKTNEPYLFQETLYISPVWLD